MRSMKSNWKEPVKDRQRERERERATREDRMIRENRERESRENDRLENQGGKGNTPGNVTRAALRPIGRLPVKHPQSDCKPPASLADTMRIQAFISPLKAPLSNFG